MRGRIWGGVLTRGGQHSPTHGEIETGRERSGRMVYRRGGGRGWSGDPAKERRGARRRSGCEASGGGTGMAGVGRAEGDEGYVPARRVAVSRTRWAFRRREEGAVRRRGDEIGRQKGPAHDGGSVALLLHLPPRRLAAPATATAIAAPALAAGAPLLAALPFLSSLV
ncbi:hypothetical protein GUJ93_ZPchr0013g34098 [Zizania palustris]|uniref:Uncharacterized protein n=1 Tax=Zizania palustris TaxID=103762 RepID=A0A8J5WXK9_ZIZPA|nr:hypothetical protein GUJ93_ZPchr0013g34098 [Zizania palustris]